MNTNSLSAQAYLQHGAGTTGPFLTESVPVESRLLPWQKAGLSYTASGYGAKIPTQYRVRWLGRWRRVYCRIYSNSGTLYIATKQAENGRIRVDIHG